MVKWLLPFNVDKYVILHAGLNNIETDYYIGSDQNRNYILTTTQEKDLGVTFDKDMKFR